MTGHLHRVLALVACAAWFVVAAPRLASAQQQEQPVLLFSAERNVPRSLQRKLTELFGKLGEVVSDGRYRDQAREQRLEPHAEESVTLLLPFEGVDLGIFAETFRRERSKYLRVRYFDGRTGRPLLRDEVPLEGGRLKAVYEYFLPARARRALESLSSAPVATAPLIAPMPQDGQPPPVPGQVAPAPVAQVPTYEPPPAWSEEDELSDSDEPLPVTAWASVGLGIATQGSDLPTDQGPAGIDGGLAAGLDVGVSAESTGDFLRFGARFDYASTIGYELTEQSPLGAERSSPARSHEFRGNLVLRVRFSDGPLAASLALAAGYAHEDLRVDLELNTAPYGVGAPTIAAGIAVPFSDRVRLQVGPQFGWLAVLDDEALQMGLRAGGPLIGGDLELFVGISRRFGLRLHYREVHLFLPTVYESGSFHETRRFITLGGVAAY